MSPGVYVPLPGIKALSLCVVIFSDVGLLHKNTLFCSNYWKHTYCLRYRISEFALFWIIIKTDNNIIYQKSVGMNVPPPHTFYCS